MAVNIRLRKRYTSLESNKDTITIGDKNNEQLVLLSGTVKRIPVDLHNGDGLIRTLEVIDTVHKRIHEGELYRGSSVITITNMGGVYYYEILPPSNDLKCHLSFEIKTDKKVEVTFLEDFNKQNQGTDVKLYNARREKADEPYTQIKENTGYTNDGLAVTIDMIALTEYDSKLKSEDRYEWILKKGKKYGLKVTSLDQNVKVYTKFILYEV